MESSYLEKINAKTDVELFRELLRFIPTANIHDYYEVGAGSWLNERMRLDIEIVAAHRDQAGAPDPPPLASIPAPDLPTRPEPGSTGIIMRQTAMAQAAATAAKRKVVGPVADIDYTHELPKGSLSTAAPQLLHDFGRDMQQLGNSNGVVIRLEPSKDRLNLRGGTRECNAAYAQLNEVIAYYFGGGGE
eukprot:TRINITY_DN25711_c0_g1_i2.p1 TRINITY_DN25711_c0_g1~~TRINITY_DN25711_c0_g1_i2.p1  ORF type:complete len:214 (-),score=41.61 TRINITY_DN25711_c0_g1_i2:35-601(-)